MTLTREDLKRLDMLPLDEALKGLRDERDIRYYTTYRANLVSRLLREDPKIARAVLKTKVGVKEDFIEELVKNLLTAPKEVVENYLNIFPEARKRYYEEMGARAGHYLYGAEEVVPPSELYMTPEERLEKELKEERMYRMLPIREVEEVKRPIFYTAEDLQLEEIRKELEDKGVIVYIKKFPAFGRTLYILYIQDETTNPKIYNMLKYKKSYDVFKDVYNNIIKPVLDKRGFVSVWQSDYNWTHPLITFKRVIG